MVLMLQVESPHAVYRYSNAPSLGANGTFILVIVE